MTATPSHTNGPLAGLRVLEFSALGPAPHACMLLADMGAEIVRIERPGSSSTVFPHIPDSSDRTMRGRNSVQVDLKVEATRDTVLDLIAEADVLVEGFRPGVLDRLGFGPEECLRRNPALIYARMTGWGQEGPMSARAGHDINYLSMTGVLDNIGAAGAPPTVPLNLVADYGGGSMLLVQGVLAALYERNGSGRGQVIDAAMVDGVGALSSLFWSLRHDGMWNLGRGGNDLDGSLPFYTTYECGDGGYVAVGSIEPQFFSELLAGLGWAPDSVDQWDRNAWPALRQRLAEAFLQHPRDHWAEVFENRDACVTPVLTMDEAAQHPHHRARESFPPFEGAPTPAAAPRFSRTPAQHAELTTGGDVGDLDACLRTWRAGRAVSAAGTS